MLRSNPGLEVTLRKGRSGSFEITVDGRLAYSKLQSGAFPSDAELARCVA